MLFIIVFVPVLIVAIRTYKHRHAYVISEEVIHVLTEQGDWLSALQLRNQIGIYRSKPSQETLDTALLILQVFGRIESRYKEEESDQPQEWRIKPSGRARRRKDLQQTKGWWNDLIPQPT